MKDNEKKVNKAEEAKTEENGMELTDEQLSKVTGGRNGHEMTLGDDRE